MAAWKDKVAKRLNTLVAMPANWDGHGALPISPAVAVMAFSTLLSAYDQRVPIPFLVPIASGGIQLEWHLAGIDIEFGIESSGMADLYVFDATTELQEVEDEGMYTSPRLREELRRAITSIARRSE